MSIHLSAGFPFANQTYRLRNGKWKSCTELQHFFLKTFMSAEDFPWSSLFSYDKHSVEHADPALPGRPHSAYALPAVPGQEVCDLGDAANDSLLPSTTCFSPSVCGYVYVYGYVYGYGYGYVYACMYICLPVCVERLTRRKTSRRQLVHCGGAIHVLRRLRRMVRRSGHSTCGYHGWSTWRTCDQF